MHHHPPHQLLLKLPASPSELVALSNLVRVPAENQFIEMFVRGELTQVRLMQLGCLWRGLGPPWSFYLQFWSTPAYIFGSVRPQQLDFSGLGRIDKVPMRVNSKGQWKKLTAREQRIYEGYWNEIARVTGYPGYSSSGPFNYRGFISWIDGLGLEGEFFDYSSSRLLKELCDSTDRGFRKMVRENQRQAAKIMCRGRDEYLLRNKNKKVGPTTVTVTMK